MFYYLLDKAVLDHFIAILFLSSDNFQFLHTDVLLITLITLLTNIILITNVIWVQNGIIFIKDTLPYFSAKSL